MPEWVNTATNEYSKRLKEFCYFSIVEIPLQKRAKDSQMDKILEKESQLILNAIPKQAYCIALDSSGNTFSSESMAQQINKLQLYNSNWCFIIGGPEGLSNEVMDRADERWSLSQLTFPHPLARIILCESLYRSFAILNNHPYHK